MRSRYTVGRYMIAVGVVTTAAFALSSGTWLGTAGEARLVAFEPIPYEAGETCEWEVAAPQRPSFALRGAAAAVQAPNADSREPLRFIQDPYPAFSSIAVDSARNEIVVTDENRFRIMVYDRLATTPASAIQTEPKRVISGLNTHTQYASDVYIDPPSGDIYVVNNDTVHNTTIYGRQAKGNVEPDREFSVMAGNFSVAVDESRQELYYTEQRESAITIYKKSSGMDDNPLRLIQGDKTRLGDPHGIAFDPKNRVLFVANYGTSHSVRPDGKGARPNWPAGRTLGYGIIPGTGKFEPPSITVYSADAVGDVAPLRVIQGPKTGLNWPTGVAVDSERQEVYVANEIGDTISVFSAAAQGDVAPIRVLKGPRTLMKNPSDVFLDLTNNEMWVASFGNHLALAYKLGASGDTAPVRIIRGSPLNTPGALIGNPFGVAYDTKREEILVTNCVSHPRIGAFARTADKNALPVRAIEGSDTKLNRTMHAIAYDALHDEIVVPSRIAGAIQTFRGAANGNEPPIRVIMGPKTQLTSENQLSIDPVNNEILIYGMGKVSVFDRTAIGDVAPKRILQTGANNVEVDPVHNLLIISRGNSIQIFDRTAEGTAKPKAVINVGDAVIKSGTGMALYPPTGAIVLTMSGIAEGGGEVGGSTPDALASDLSYVAVWNINDSGNAPPRWTFAGPKGVLRNPRSLTLDVKHKTVIVSDKYLNGVLTYSFPALFDTEGPRQTARVASR